MKIVFLGCGYLGYNLTLGLSKVADVKCIGLQSEYSGLLKKQFVEVNVFDETAMMKLDLKDAIVIDTVALIGNQTKSDDEDKLLNSVKEKYEMLFRVLQRQQIKQFLFFSSGGTVYGNATKPIKEDYQCNPISLYARSKVMLEKCLMTCGLNYLILRVANPYGGFQMTNKRQGVIPVLIEKAINNEVFELWGSLNSIRDYFYIDDFTNMVYSLLKSDIRNEVVNIGSGEGTSLRTIIDLVQKYTKKDIQIKEIESTVALVDEIVLNVDKLKKLSGFVHQFSIDEGIELEVKRIMEGN